MNRGDLQTFYPNHTGSGLNEFGFFVQGGYESSFNDENDPDLDDSKDDQESTEYENEEAEVPGVRDKCPILEFRSHVKAKKVELKSQYGKGHISIGECGVKPINPDIRFPNTICLWDCSKEKNYNKDCCAFNRNQAEKRAEQRQKIADWERCRAENKGVWVPGWRKEWRKFKKSGGLNQLRDLCRGVSAPATTADSGLSCTQLQAQYGIVAGKSWGTAPAEIRNEWVNKKCTGPAQQNVSRQTGEYVEGMSCRDMMTEFGIIPGKTFGNAPIEAINAWKNNKCTGNEAVSASKPGSSLESNEERNKKMIIIGVISVVVIMVIAFIVRAMRNKA